MPVKSIANLAVTGQALTLASASFPKKGKKVTTKDILKQGTGIIIGSSLLKSTAQSVGDL